MRDLAGGLYTRHYFEEFWKGENRRAERYQTPLSLAFFRVRDLASLEAASGHLLADQAVALVGSTIKQSVRSSDLAARYSSDIFVVVFTHTNSIGARRASHRVVAAAREAAAALLPDLDLQIDTAVQGSEDGYAEMLERALRLVLASSPASR